MPHLSSSQAAQFLTMPFRRHKQRYVINPPDEQHNVTYLGNVLTILAKGDQSIERPLVAIWRSYTTRKRDVPMKLTVTRSGLKVETKQLGVTEYWAHRITYCFAPPDYPRVFCWVYKHEGKRMKPELRCHAVLCKKQSEPAQIVATLTGYLQAALQEYKREKLTMEKARKNSVTSGGCPRRKLILQTGTLNFRPPVNRSKSAPRLGSIDEEDEERMDGLMEEAVDEEGVEETSMSDYEYDESSDIESLNYRATPLLGDTYRHPTIQTTYSLTDDQLSQASTSSASTASSSTNNFHLTGSKSFEGQLLSCGNYNYSNEENSVTETTKNEEEDEEEEDPPTQFFPHRQLSLTSANRKRLQPERLLMKASSVDEQKFKKRVDKTELESPEKSEENVDVKESENDSKQNFQQLRNKFQVPQQDTSDIKTPESINLDQLSQQIDSSLVLEEDELAAESTNSCASSDDGFGSSCHENDSNHNRPMLRKIPKITSQTTTESDFLSDDSATDDSDRQSLQKMENEPEVAQIRRILMANQQVTAL